MGLLEVALAGDWVVLGEFARAVLSADQGGQLDVQRSRVAVINGQSGYCSRRTVSTQSCSSSNLASFSSSVMVSQNHCAGDASFSVSRMARICPICWRSCETSARVWLWRRWVLARPSTLRVSAWMSRRRRLTWMARAATDGDSSRPCGSSVIKPRLRDQLAGHGLARGERSG